MNEDSLSLDERRQLLMLARVSIEKAVCGQPISLPDCNLLPSRLRADGVCFVTLTTADGELRGCVGGLEARQPLAHDVCDHAVAAAQQDYRFLPVQPEELPSLRIEISRLTPAQSLEYDQPEALPGLLHPMIDGVILRDGHRRATFLPQVWEKLPDPADFLSHLCYKMGVPADLWRHKKLHVDIYHVEEFHESP